MNDVIAQHCADSCRFALEHVNLSCEAGRSQYARIEHCINVLQNLAHDLSPAGIVRSIISLHGYSSAESFLSEGQSSRRMSRPAYKVAYMLKVMCCADMLRNSGSLRDVAKHILSMLLPKSLQKHMMQLLNLLKHMVPSKSTISRWRLLIDGALMIKQRGVLDEMRVNGGYVAQIQADSSMQHGREFEHVYFQVIAIPDLPILAKTASSLYELWCLYIQYTYLRILTKKYVIRLLVYNK
jgi:hypothetical protein